MNDNNNIGKIIINEDTIKTMKDLHGIDALAEAKRAVEHEAAKEDRQVFFIDIGDVPPQEVQTYLDKIKSDIKDRQSTRYEGRLFLRLSSQCVCAQEEILVHQDIW
jgi:hypothetical protein